MPRRFSLICLAVLLAIALSWPSAAVAGPVMTRILEKGTLVVGTSGSQPPMSATSKKGELMGFDIDLARAMAEGLGVKAEFVTMPFTELLQALEAGKVDVVLSGMTITPARNRNVAFVGPYYISGKGLLARLERYAALKSAEGLNAPGVTVTALKDSTSQQFAETLMPQAKLVPTASYDEAIDLILSGKADVLVADFPFCALTAYRNQDKKLAAGEAPLTYEPLGIGMMEDALLMNWTANFLNVLQGTGALKKMHEKWLNGGSWIDELP
jgi:polar amino acid transport system substrate-binding protein